MAGTMFVVCVPTKELETELLMRQEPGGGLKSASSTNNLPKAAAADLNSRLGSTRSRSEESVYATSQGEDGGASRPREMFIGPWRVDASDLPLLSPGRAPPSARSPRSPRSASQGPGGPGGLGPLLDTANMSRSDPEGINAKPPGTPVSNFKKRRHRFLETELEKVLKELNIPNAVWCLGRSKRFYQVLFSIESGESCEEALKKLADRGIGLLLNSVVSVLPCVLYYQGSEKSAADSMEYPHDDVFGKQENECYDAAGSTGGANTNKARNEQGVWKCFVQSVRARLTVAQVVEGVRANATFTFDFLLLLIVAACVAALGLLEDSTVILVASMLISPLMGPVMAATFGTMIHDRHLQWMGLINECAGLLLSLLLGFGIGLGVGFLDQPWPTQEMLDSVITSRGQLHSLWVNVLIAVLSGAGIAIALLRDNTGSLVGVAISASLLPPAVNAGLLWGMSLVYNILGPQAGEDIPHDYSSYYSDEPAVEMAVMGGISLCITFINIVFIYLTGILMLKIKEVAPNSQAHHRFWKHDVRIARDYNTTLFGASAADILRSVVNQDCDPKCRQGEDAAVQNLTPEFARLLRLSSGISSHFSGVPRGHDGDSHYLGPCSQHQLTWSPSTLGATSTVRELEELYRTIRQHQLHQRQGGAAAAARRSSASNGGLSCGPPSSSYPSWRLGSSDGYRCSLSKTPVSRADKCRCGGGQARQCAPGGAARAAASGQVGVYVTASTPPFDNMPSRRPLLARLGSGSSAFRTPLPDPAAASATTVIGVPQSPLFQTPINGDASATATVLSLDDETASATSSETAALWAASPGKKKRKKRFVVTKADDSEPLLPRDAV